MTHHNSLFDVERRTLTNGLQVWVKPRPGTGSVAAALVVRVGSRDETPDVAGISHFLEHLLFDGTGRWDEQAVRRVIESVGGSFNGWTGDEGTGFEVEVESIHLETALDWLAEIVFRSTLPPDKVDKEREVLYQERGGRLGFFLNFFFDLLDRLGVVYDMRREVVRRLLPGSRLEQQVIGQERTLARLSRQQLLTHYHRYYIPNNAVLILVGDTTTADAFALVERYFGGFSPGLRPPAPPMPGPAPGRFVHIRMRWPYWIDRALMRLGARTVGFRDRDRYALSVLAWMLTDRLWSELREERGLVYGVVAYNHEYTDGGYFAIESDFDGEQLETILDSVRQRLEDCKQGRFSEADLVRAKQVLRGRAMLELDSNYDLAIVFTEYALYVGPDEPLPDYLREIAAVTADDIRRVANNYFQPDNSYLALFRPAFTLREALIGSGAVAVAALPLITRTLRRGRYRRKPRH